MVAPVDIFIYFSSRPSFLALGSTIESRPSSGGGRIVVRQPGGEIPQLIEAARLNVGGAPLGMVTDTEADALTAIGSGADEAAVLVGQGEAEITRFLDRVLLRARNRHEAEQQTHDFAQAEKLSALGTLIAGVGHEINNPLSTMILGYDVLRENAVPDLDAMWKARQILKEQGQLDEAAVADLLKVVRERRMDVRDLLADITEAGTAVTQLVQDLRVFSRNNAAERPALFKPQDLIEQALRLVRREFGANTVIEQDYSDDLPGLLLPQNRLAQVITNLLVNAGHAIGSIKRPGHRVRIGARVDDDAIAISISDTGPGISEGILERIFDPFFTTKREGMGTGLGLSISRNIVRDMGGDLTVSSVYGEGATFICFLPLPSEQQLARFGVPRPAVPSVPASSKRCSVLIIDDDEHVLRAASRSLSKHYKVLVARDGEEASEMLASGSHADVVVTELELPELDGPGFVAWLKENRPDLATRLVVATAAQERPKYRDFLRDFDGIVLHKPLEAGALVQAVEGLLE